MQPKFQLWVCWEPREASPGKREGVQGSEGERGFESHAFPPASPFTFVVHVLRGRAAPLPSLLSVANNPLILWPQISWATAECCYGNCNLLGKGF